MSKFGIKIKNISAGMLYDVNLGIRDYFTYTDAIFHNSRFSDFLKANGLKIHKGTSTRDLVCLDFDFGSRSYSEEQKRLQKMLDQERNPSEREKIEQIIAKVERNKDKYTGKTKEEIREDFYQNDVPITYNTYAKDGSIKKSETITYRMLYRTSAKAKTGQAVFINTKLYDKAYDWLTMGIGKKLPIHNAKIVELSAYAPLTTSTTIDNIHIPVNNILILKDQDSVFQTLAKVVRAETSEDGEKKCVVDTTETQVKNTLWDGMGIIDDSLFPEYANGMMLLRNHFFKMDGFRGYLKRFFRDWCKKNGHDYNTYQVPDMFGNMHYLADIQVITTDNAIKWKKFTEYMGGSLPEAYRYWCKRISADGDLWGVVKTDHTSKLGKFQQMSYQMINTLPCTKNDIEEITDDSIEYVCDLKTDPDVFYRFLRRKATEVNHYDMMADLYDHNPEFANSTWFREEKKKIINNYVSKLRTGKIMVNGDNLTVCGNPYALLLYSVGESWEDDPTMHEEDGSIQCYTTRFRDDEYLAAFRNPHNSPNNVMYLHNVYSEEMQRYFPFSPNILAVNCIHTDIQDRSNGCDFDSDFFFVTAHPTMVRLAETCYKEFPTIVNGLHESGITYDNTRLAYAQMDNKFAQSQLGIGQSSNLAQLALTYYWTEIASNSSDARKLSELYDNFVILSVLAQVIIDGCKREYEIDAMKEIRRIQKLPSMVLLDSNGRKKDFPEFMKWTREIPLTTNRRERDYEEVKQDKDRLKNRINHELICPMNWVEECLDSIPYAPSTNTLPNESFFIKMNGRGHWRHVPKIMSIIEEYDKYNSEVMKYGTDESLELMICKLNEIVERLKKMKNVNVVVMNRLIEIALGIASNSGVSKQQMIGLSKFPKKTLLLLYKMNKSNFLLNFEPKN